MPVISAAGKAASVKDSLPALTGVRFLAALYVVVFHFRDVLPQNLRSTPSVAEFLSKGYLGVSLFFLLSGFILAVVYHSRLKTWTDCRRFFIARLARVYPVYLLALLLIYLLTYAHEPSEFCWSQGIQVLFLVQAWHPVNHAIAGYWNPVAWTLSVEAFFYVCFPPILMLIQRRRNRWLALSLSTVLLVAVLCKTPEMQLFQMIDRGKLANSLPFAILRLPEFIAGMLLGLFFTRRNLGRSRWPWTYAGLFGALLLLFLPLHGWNSLIVLPASALIYGLATQTTFLSFALSSTAMQRLGHASYAIYLLQLGVNALVEHVLLRISPGAFSSADRITFVVLILFSLVVYRFWEEPLRYQIRARFMGSPKRQRQ
jgi:peptidoglycan/LPS O-acetylase OafA/YrhL